MRMNKSDMIFGFVIGILLVVIFFLMKAIPSLAGICVILHNLSVVVSAQILGIVISKGLNKIK